MGLFSFLADLGTYEERKVARFNGDGFFVSTCRVSDSTKPFETAVSHPLYDEGKIIIVATYDTPQEAKEGHEKWVKRMTSDSLPNELKDVSLSGVGRLSAAAGNPTVFPVAEPKET